jgi:hypothetical protein
MRFEARIQKLEMAAAPIKAEQQRMLKNKQLREMIFRDRKDYIESQLALCRYVFGADLDEEEWTKDIIEIDALYHHEATERFGADERGFYKATEEQLEEVSREVGMRFDRHFYGIFETAEQFKEEQQRWKRVREDLEGGVASAVSEAAEHIRQHFGRYPRRLNAKRFLSVWD